MTKMPVVSGRQLVKALAKVGYLFDHQQGSHIILRHDFPLIVVLLFRTIKKSPKGHCDRLFEKVVCLYRNSSSFFNAVIIQHYRCNGSTSGLRHIETCNPEGDPLIRAALDPGKILYERPECRSIP